MRTFKEIIKEGNEGFSFRYIIENLTDQEIFDCVEEYVNQINKCNCIKNKSFLVEWRRSHSYGLGYGTEYIEAENEKEALVKFWNGKNIEAIEIISTSQVK